MLMHCHEGRLERDSNESQVAMRFRQPLAKHYTTSPDFG